MLAATELDEKTSREASGIGDVRPNRNLPPKMRAFEREAIECAPELPLGICAARPQGLGAVEAEPPHPVRAAAGLRERRGRVTGAAKSGADALVCALCGGTFTPPRPLRGRPSP